METDSPKDHPETWEEYRAGKPDLEEVVEQRLGNLKEMEEAVPGLGGTSN